jgi:hypothetical protein
VQNEDEDFQHGCESPSAPLKIIKHSAVLSQHLCEQFLVMLCNVTVYIVTVVFCHKSLHQYSKTNVMHCLAAAN